MFDTIMLHCFLYCAQVLSENRSSCIKPCSYGNHNGFVIVEASTPSSYLASAFACVKSGRELTRVGRGDANCTHAPVHSMQEVLMTHW